jgi:hypothetical protein
LSLKKTIQECIPIADPLARPHYTEAEAQAVRACFSGEANARQQRMALDYMMRAFGTHDTSFRPGDQYLTAFAEGRRHAGTTLRWMLFDAPTRTDPDKIATRKIEDDPNARPDNR